MVKTLILVGFGGMLGSIARFVVGYALHRPVPTGFPYGTFAVNVLGCFAIGVIFGLSERWAWPTPEWRLFLATGFCGGFTTFSAFSYESVVLLEQNDYATFILYAALSFAVCLAVTFLGLVISKP